MIAQDLYIAANNHTFSRIDIPMRVQGYTPQKRTVIEDDVWIGARVIITLGRIISIGSIIAAGAVVTKNVGPFEIWGGVPAKFIKSRITNK